MLIVNNILFKNLHPTGILITEQSKCQQIPLFQLAIDTVFFCKHVQLKQINTQAQHTQTRSNYSQISAVCGSVMYIIHCSTVYIAFSTEISL
jgi:hypothetical protein